ncbi:response regulator transcription factor [Streptomyces xinghaiensis]|uniref:response regulator transcription factor n=1 Tax=Streptomyces xinghaiensis TaxID=1038928 RepID=UPI002E15359E|nr:response regulator transcription factor [Streptomyces xinghaiensis]
MIRVVVVDGEALVRTALRQILQSTDGMRVVGEDDGRGAVATVAETAPDVLLLGAGGPVGDGTAVLRGVRALPAPPAVALLTPADTGERMVHALREGAAGLLFRDIAPATLVDAVRVVAAGGTVLAPAVRGAVIDEYLGVGAAGTGAAPGMPAAAGRLTCREREVLALVATGLSNAEIAACLDLGTGTVKDHVSALRRKLGARNRVTAAVAAHRLGLVPAPQDAVSARTPACAHGFSPAPRPRAAREAGSR